MSLHLNLVLALNLLLICFLLFFLFSLTFFALFLCLFDGAVAWYWVFILAVGDFIRRMLAYVVEVVVLALFLILWVVSLCVPAVFALADEAPVFILDAIIASES